MLEAHYLPVISKPFFFFVPAQRSEGHLWMVSPCSPSRASTWSVSWVSAVAAESRSRTWRHAWCTCCTPASAALCLNAKAPTPAYTVHTERTGGSARQLNSAKWSEADARLRLLFACVCVGARLTSDWLTLSLGWCVGDTRGLSGRCVLCSSYEPLLSKTNENWAFER